MTNKDDDPYLFSMNESVSETPQTRSSNRNRKVPNKKASKGDEQRIVTRSSQKTPVTPINDDNDNSFMSNINSGFSQFVNPKKRQRDDKKTKTTKKPKMTTFSDENQPPDEEIQTIQQVKLIYETAGGRTNLARAAATNAQILAKRPTSNTNTTYNIHVIDDTQTETLAIPDTIPDFDTQHNDSSWQRDIDRLMKKLEEPSTSAVKSQTQIQETQIDEEISGPIYLSQTGKTHPRPSQTRPQPTQTHPQPTQTHPQPIQSHPQPMQTTTIIQKDEIGIQTENSQNSSSIHSCCQDVSTCPCVLRYSKLERLFMEKMSRFISIVPTVPNSTINNENHHRRRNVQSYSRFRRFRGQRRINHRINKPSIENNQSSTIEEISDETTTTTPTPPPTTTAVTTEIDHQADETIEEAIPSSNNIINNNNNPTENIISTTITIEKTGQLINDLSSIEKIDETTMIDHPSTLLISSNNTCSTGRTLVLTTSSLDENQKTQFRQFLTRFNISSSSTVDSSTTHIIVNEHSPLVCPLTGKIIQGIARHLFIVSNRWINECLNEDSIIDERPFEIRGDTSLGIDHGGMRRSRLTPSYLLEKYSICLRCSSSDCAPLQTIEQVQELIQLCGGKLVHNFSEIKTIDNQRQMILVLGISGFTGGEKKKKALLDTCQQFNVKCVNIHWLLISIAKFEIQSFDNYDINQI